MLIPVWANYQFVQFVITFEWSKTYNILYKLWQIMPQFVSPRYIELFRQASLHRVAGY